MSQAGPPSRLPSRGLVTPRWSMIGGGQVPSVTASMAGLPEISAWVCGGALGNIGLRICASAWVGTRSGAAGVKPSTPASLSNPNRLKLPAVTMVPAVELAATSRALGAVLPAINVRAKFSAPPAAATPPPVAAVLAERVLLMRLTVLLSAYTPPPLSAAVLPETVVLVSVKVPPLMSSPPPLPLLVTPATAVALPPLTVVSSKLRLPPVSMVKMRKGGAVGARVTVLPLPSRVMALLMVGSSAVRVWVLFGGNTSVSVALPGVHPPAVPSVLAAVMASERTHVAPSTLMVAARAAP